MRKLFIIALLALPISGCNTRVLPDGTFEVKTDTSAIVNIMFTYAERRAPLEMQFQDPNTSPQDRILIGKKLDILDTTANQLLMASLGWLDKVKISNIELPALPAKVVTSYPTKAGGTSNVPGQ